MVRGLASGGTIDEASRGQPGQLVVQPEALRYPLVRDMFFGGPGSPSVKGAVATLPNASAASFPLIAAALAGAGVDLEWLEVAKLIATADSDARQAGITYPRLTPKLVEHLASASGDPHALLLALEECGAAADLLIEVLNSLADRQSPALEAALERLLAQRSTVPAAVAVGLTRPVSRHVKEQAIAQMSLGGFDIDGLIIRNELDEVTLELLLTAPDQELAWRVALALWGWRHREALDGLRDDLRQLSRDLIVNHPAEDQLYQSVFEQEPEVLVDSIRAWWERLRTGSLEFWPIEVGDLIAGLSYRDAAGSHCRHSR